MWPELLSHIEGWLNRTLFHSTGYSPVELIFVSSRSDLFEEFLKKGSEQKKTVDSLQEKVLKAYVRMKEKAAKRNKRGKNSSLKWKPQVGDLVLAKSHAVADAANGITKKFARPYDAPWKVTRMITPTTYKVADEKGKITKVFNQKVTKPYLPSME